MTVYLDIENKQIQYENNDKLIPLSLSEEEVASIKSSKIAEYIKDKIDNIMNYGV